MKFETSPFEITPPVQMMRDNPSWPMRLHLWETRIRQAVQEEDAWGLLGMRPDCDVMIFDVSPEGIARCANWSVSVHLIKPCPGEVF